MPQATVLIVDDDEGTRDGLSRALWRTEYDFIVADGPRAAFDVLGKEKVDIVVSDQLMPEMNGLDFLKIVGDRHPSVIRILLTGHGDMETAVEAINAGTLFRYLLKPCSHAQLLATLHHACEKIEAKQENQRLLTLIRSRPLVLMKLEEEREERRAQLVSRYAEAHGQLTSDPSP
jgi:DNA-binding NtrC family response regulator